MMSRRCGAWSGMRYLAVIAVVLSACSVGSKSAGELESSESSESGEASESGESSEASESGTSGPTCEAEVYADDYDRTCAEDADCVAVFEGEATNECRECAFSAINVAEQEAYVEALGPITCSAAECGADCIQGHLMPGVCLDNQCEMGMPIVCGADVPCNAVTGFCLGVEPGEPGVFECVPLPEACEGSTDCACLLGSDAELDVCIEQGSCSHDGTAFRVFCPDG